MRTGTLAAVTAALVAATLALTVAHSQAPAPVRPQQLAQAHEEGLPSPVVEPRPLPLPADPLQRCATRAMRGDFGKLRDWQRAGYRVALDTGATVQGRAWVTGYYPWEHDGNNTRSGRKPSLRSAAVQRRDFHRHLWAYVWTAAYGIRIVEDSGANSNTGEARENGADAWLDYYWRTRHDRNPVTDYAIFGRSK